MTFEERVTGLIAICRENADNYHGAAEILVGEPDRAHFFDETAENRLLAANALETKLFESGKRLSSEILAAPPTEGWTRPTGEEIDPRAIIEACHEAEERALNAFEDALKTLPQDWHWVLNEYCQHIRSSRAKMHAWLAGKETEEKRERSGVRAAANRIISPDR